MSSSTEPVNIMWDVTFGAVFKSTVGKKSVPKLSLRTYDGKWMEAFEITDPTGLYTNLGVDQVSIAHVRCRDKEHSLLDLYTVTLNEAGDSTTVARAVKGGIFGDLVEKIFKERLDKDGPILYESGEPTILTPDMLIGYCDSADFDALKKAYAYELLEARGEADDHYNKMVAAFETFLAKFKPGDELYWFEKIAPLASRLGYVIARKGRVHAAKIEMMS
jgi:hypothetical protein